MAEFTANAPIIGENRPLQSDPGLYPSHRNYGQFSTGGSLHDTFRVDRYENLYDTHTSVYLPDGRKKRLDW